MRPVAIFEHQPHVQPGHFLQWLRARGLPYRVIAIHAGDAIPTDPTKFSGLCFMGGTMSVNDALPWVAAELELIRGADACGVPVIGHCLGGQLIAKALGATVGRNPVKEIGWSRVTVADAALARDWLGATPSEIEVFQWHGETFALPAGAQRLLANAWCGNQAYVIERGGYAHLGMQFHIEMTPELVRLWSGKATARTEIEAERRATGGPAVQDPEQQRVDLVARVARMRTLADALYDRWARGLARPTSD